MARRISTINERLERSREEGEFKRRVTRVIDDCVRLAASDNVPRETTEYCIKRMEALARNIDRARGILVDDKTYHELHQNLERLLEEFRRGNQEEAVHTGYQAERTAPTKGAPRYDITKEQLAFLLHCGFGQPRIADLLGVSLSTVRRRTRSFELRRSVEYSQMSDEDLDRLVTRTVQGNRRIGPNAVRARLFSRVRESMLRVDPGGAALRAAPPLQRQTYRVAGPNSLWHIDGNHKLVRWKVIIHGGIDGYSRMIVFLHASDNNRKETVLDHFVAATTRCGLPSRIRVDQGGENNEICELMDLLRGVDRGSAIRGRSVHNQRIDRNWVDLWNGATNLYYDLFNFMEVYGHLHPNDNIHLWALHYIYMPRLNKALQDFVQQWNFHGLRTEHHQSPIQLFVGRSLELCHSRLTAMGDLFRSPITPDRDEVQDVFNQPEWEAAVNIPHVPCPLNGDYLERLKEAVDPLSESDELGIRSYLQVISFIREMTC